MTFTYKLARRLARLKGWTAIVATVVAATIFGCELPVRTTDTGSTIAQLLVSPKNVSLQPNQAQDFLAVGFTATGDSADASVTWSASGGSVTSSSAGKRHYGLYQNATCGAFTVVATSNPGALSDTAVVTVSGCTVPVASVTVTPASATVRTGQGVQLTATPKDANGTPLAGRVVTWASSNTALAVVDVNGNVTGMSPGSATITATSEGQRGTATIAVTSIPVASVTVSPSPASVVVGQTVQLTATPKDANGTPLTGRVVTWASNNTTVATVNGSGLVTGRAAGSATITATSEGQSGSSVVTATPAPVATVTVSPSPASVGVGQTVQLTATPKDASGNPLSGRVITWSTDNASVATVNGSGLVSGVVAGTATITATSEGKSGTSAITVTAPVASVTVSPAPASVVVGQTVQLTATPKDANGNPLSGRVVTWSSDNTTVATVNGSGLVTGKAAGTATITATSEGQSGTSVVTATPAPVATVTVSPSPASVVVTQTVQLTATPKDASGNPLSGRVITWSTDNASVATADGSGLVSGVAIGSATITATSEGKSGTSIVTVTNVPVATVTVSPSPASVVAGQTVQLTATPKDANGNPLTGRVVTWSSNNTSVATVNGSGLVSGVAAGSATITATSEGKSGTSAITVTPVPVASVTVTPAPASVYVGQTVQLTATPKDANGNPLTGRVVTWSSNNTAVATVNSSGRVSGVTVGSATITATSEGQSGTSSVTVTLAPVGSVTVTPSPASVQVGLTVQLTATPKDANGNPLSGRVVTWSSNNTGVATVNGSGLVSGVTAGSATITATSEGQSGTSSVTVTTPGTSQFGHVFIVTEENTDYVDVIGNSSMPYLNSLATQYGLATQYYANTHPSIGNYFELSTGQIITNNDSYSSIVSVDNIVRQLGAAGKTWKSYAESIPRACYLGGDTGNYARKHNIFALLSDVANDPVQACNNVPFTQFATDLANGTLPSFSNIVPDLCNDAHDCGLDVADSWLQANIAPLIASPVFQQDGLLIILFDESGGDNTHGGGKVVWVAVSPKSKLSYQSTTLYQHQSTLRLMLKGLGVSAFPGAAATAPDMSEFFNP